MMMRLHRGFRLAACTMSTLLAGGLGAAACQSSSGTAQENRDAATVGSSGAASGSGSGSGSSGGVPASSGAPSGSTSSGGAASSGGSSGSGSGGGPSSSGGGSSSSGDGGDSGVPASSGSSSGGGDGGAMACPTVSDLTMWPTGKGPADVGKLAASDFKGHTGDTYGGAGYALAFSWFGALRFTKITGDTQNNLSLISAFEPYATGQVTVDNSASATVDFRAFGDLPLEIYLQNADMRCLTLGLARADAQWVNTDANGITRDARFWADDMFMITGLQVAAYRATKDSKYLDRSAKTMTAYSTALQQSGGLFWHTMTSKAFWGRANGWVASGMTELLLELPNGSVRDSIMAGYKKLIDGLLPLQINGGADDGMWRQVLDLGSAPAESSCTAMFTYALVNGVRNGWLTDPKYAAAARKGWLAVANKTNGAGKLDRVCPGTGAAPAGSLTSQQQFYASITLGLGDLHGQAPLLWTASALLRPDCPGIR